MAMYPDNQSRMQQYQPQPQYQPQQQYQQSQPSISQGQPSQIIPGSQSQQPSLPNSSPDAGSESGVAEFCATLFAFLLFILTFPIAVWMCFKQVQEYERAVIFRLGRLKKGPGLFFILPCIDDYRCIDLRTVTFDVPPQVILTQDSVTVAVVFYKVSNPVIAVSKVTNFNQSTQLLASTTLRNVMGTKKLSEILAQRDSISHIMQEALDGATDPWGVKVERVEIKDARLPIELQRAMAAEAEAGREARAKIVAAEGEVNSSRALKEASDMMSGSSGALQLKYLQTLTQIAAEKNSTIIFPLPIDMLLPFVGKR